MVHGISKFQSRQNGYEATLKTCSMMQRLPLFQYLNGWLVEPAERTGENNRAVLRALASATQIQA